MSSNLRIDTSMDFDDYEQEQRRQQLLAKRAAIDAEIAALPSSTPQSSYQHHRSPIHKQHQQRRSSNVPRSMSSNGVPPTGRHLSATDMSQRPRALSQRSSTSMARVNSRGSSSQQRMNVPFTQHGAVPPPLHSEPRRENSVIMDWVSQEQPLTAYTFSHQAPQLQRSTSQRTSGLEQVPEQHVPELDLVGEDPSDYIFRTMGAALSPSMSLPSSATINNHRLSTGSFNLQTPSTPTSDSLTTATTLTSDMSRQNSLCNGLESMQMKFTSNNSFSTDPYNDQPMYDLATHFSSSRHSRRSSDEEQSQLLVGTGGASHESQFSHPFQFPSSPTFGEKMEKSQSNESTSSSASSSSRNVERLRDQINLAAARPLMPKGGSEGNVMSREASSQSMARIESKDGSQDKVAISKPTYQRPKHDRVYCKICDNHQDGFRGEHELRRHVDREHKTMVKKFMCIEPTDGLNHPKPVVPLSRCKACTQQKKKYGAYYNAAAHLRRAHFNPKSKGRSKSQQKADDAEKRGGKGGGDWPPMSECKLWMKEVEEQVTEYLTDAQQEAADASDDEGFDNSIEDQHFSHQSIPDMGNNAYDNTYITEVSPAINIYQPVVNVNSNDIYGMQNIPIDLSGTGQQTQCMDQTMYMSNTSTFPSTFSSDSFQNDPIAAFLDNPSIQPQGYNTFGWN